MAQRETGEEYYPRGEAGLKSLIAATTAKLERISTALVAFEKHKIDASLLREDYKYYMTRLIELQRRLNELN